MGSVARSPEMWSSQKSSKVDTPLTHPFYTYTFTILTLTYTDWTYINSLFGYYNGSVFVFFADIMV